MKEHGGAGDEPPDGAAPPENQAASAPAAHAGNPEHANPERPAEPPAQPAPAPKRGGLPLWLLLIGGVCLLALIALPIIGFLAWGPYTRKLVIESARERGVEIDPERVEVPFNLKSAKLTNTRFRLIGVEGLTGEIRDLQVELDNKSPKSFELTGVELKVIGSAARLALELSEWTSAHPSLYGNAMTAREVDVSWREAEGKEPWLSLKGGEVAPSEGGARFSASGATIAGVDTGALGASWSGERAQVSMGFGAAQGAQAPVSLTVVHTPGRDSGAYAPYAELKVAKFPLDRLAGPLAVPIDTKDVTLELSSRFEFESELMGGPVNGQLTATLIGFTPPKPDELSHYDFGDSTSFTTRFALDSERKKLSLTETKVTAGSFKLKGDGEVEWLEDHARILLKLLANLPCADLAAAAVEDKLKQLGPLGKLAGNLAKNVLKGSVGVTVVIDADSRDLKSAKVAKLIGVGCGLKPLTLPSLSDFPDLKDIPLPEGFPKELPKGLPELPKDLPKLPSELPKLPSELPGFSFPSKPAPKPAPAPAPAGSAK